MVGLHWVLASGNVGKAQEFSALLAGSGLNGLRLTAQSDLGVSATDEPFETFIENGLRKARHAAEQTGLPALADDSGLVVSALGGRPGVESARFLKAHGCQGLLDALGGATDRSAHFVCCLVFVRHAQDPDPLLAVGRWHGQIAQSLCGEQGFGYDPLFLDPELGQTAAQMSADQKNTRSHRGRAFAALIAQGRDLGLWSS
ncbi:MAG: RdgB/HAM1 family non-canonical purine pyrophosphatase [Pseudomonadota bacterium]